MQCYPTSVHGFISGNPLYKQSDTCKKVAALVCPQVIELQPEDLQHQSQRRSPFMAPPPFHPTAVSGAPYAPPPPPHSTLVSPRPATGMLFMPTFPTDQANCSPQLQITLAMAKSCSVAIWILTSLLILTREYTSCLMRISRCRCATAKDESAEAHRKFVHFFYTLGLWQ